MQQNTTPELNNLPQSPEDEISLIDLCAVLLRYKKLIIGLTAAGAVFSVVFALLSLKLPAEKSFLPNLYTPKAHMLINDPNAQGGGLSSLINSSGLGSLAGLAGISAKGGASYGSLAVYLAGSNSFLDALITEFNLVERYEIKKSLKADTRKALLKYLQATLDDKTGVFTLSFTDIDPVFAQKVVNYAVEYLENRFTEMGLDKNKLEKSNLEQNIHNTYTEIVRLQNKSKKLEESVSGGLQSAHIPSIMLEINMLKLELKAQEAVYAQLKTQYELLKIKIASETPVFQILERAEVPDKKSKPSRGKLCIIITFASAFISVFIAFLLNAVSNIKKDEEAMAKLKGIKK
ncbi:lipopolysaccharide biosynthesis protein [Treponema sp. HNW]|uniref:lipopolysaccharide biosynthesis protein n=1 Tax=Treponema sp. HNW TaxID=3116654 RepID=UPI003D10DCC3